MRILKAALLYFAIVFGVGFVLGTIRTLWLVPRLGARAAELLEMPVMLVVIVVGSTVGCPQPVSTLHEICAAWSRLYRTHSDAGCRVWLCALAQARQHQAVPCYARPRCGHVLLHHAWGICAHAAVGGQSKENLICGPTGYSRPLRFAPFIADLASTYNRNALDATHF
jgi:hypothetical protein